MASFGGFGSCVGKSSDTTLRRNYALCLHLGHADGRDVWGIVCSWAQNWSIDINTLKYVEIRRKQRCRALLQVRVYMLQRRWLTTFQCPTCGVVKPNKQESNQGEKAHKLLRS